MGFGKIIIVVKAVPQMLRVAFWGHYGQFGLINLALLRLVKIS